jgi:hypothetical protein
VLGIQAQPNYNSELFKALNDIGYFPKWVVLNTNNYDPVTISEGGTNLDKFTGGLLISGRFPPFELGQSDPTHYPATAQFVQIVRQYQNVVPKALGVNAFSAWLELRVERHAPMRPGLRTGADKLDSGRAARSREAGKRDRRRLPVLHAHQGDVRGVRPRPRRDQAQSGHLQL